MGRVRRFLEAAVVLLCAWIAFAVPPAVAAPDGQMILAQTVSIAPRWLDPAEAEGIITPFIFYYALHDALGLIREQATELDRGKREAILHRIQQLMHDKAMFAPIFELASLGGYGSRVTESGLGLIASMAASAPYEDLKLKGK